MLTTASITFSATSAMTSVPRTAPDAVEAAGKTIAVAATAAKARPADLPGKLGESAEHERLAPEV